jgi:hypothetical protein
MCLVSCDGLWCGCLHKQFHLESNNQHSTRKRSLRNWDWMKTRKLRPEKRLFTLFELLTYIWQLLVGRRKSYHVVDRLKSGKSWSGGQVKRNGKTPQAVCNLPLDLISGSGWNSPFHKSLALLVPWLFMSCSRKEQTVLQRGRSLGKTAHCPLLLPTEVRPALHVNNFICRNHCIMVIKIIILRSCREVCNVLSNALEDKRVGNFHRWVERHYDATKRVKEQYGNLWSYHDFGWSSARNA